MEFSNRKQREVLLQLLFSWDHAPLDVEAIVPVLMEVLAISKKQMFAIHENFLQLKARLDQVDHALREASTNYSFDEISKMDKNILRIGVYELLFEKLDVKIVVKECIRLSNKFSTPEAGSYLHAVIDTVAKQQEVESISV